MPTWRRGRPTGRSSPTSRHERPLPPAPDKHRASALARGRGGAGRASWRRSLIGPTTTTTPYAGPEAPGSRHRAAEIDPPARRAPRRAGRVRPRNRRCMGSCGRGIGIGAADRRPRGRRLAPAGVRTLFDRPRDGGPGGGLAAVARRARPALRPASAIAVAARRPEGIPGARLFRLRRGGPIRGGAHAARGGARGLGHWRRRRPAHPRHRPYPGPGGPLRRRADVYWLRAYGGGLFLPFADASSGVDTYGGGQYVLDSIKGADLGMAGGRLILDFNFAYYPSCARDAVWTCPLAPAGNRLPLGVAAGQRG